MKIVVIGGTGLIGSKVVRKLREQGHDAVAAALNTGVNTLTGAGLREAFTGAAAVVDLSNSPSFDDKPAMEFFQTSTRNQLAMEAETGVRHHIALSVVGTERLQDSGYFRAKQAQENLIKASSIPYSIVHATQFFEFVQSIAGFSMVGDVVRLSHDLIQPMASEDVAAAVASVAMGAPLNGLIEVGGPEAIPLDVLVQRSLAARKDPRKVVMDPQAPYFGVKISERTLLPGNGARLGKIRFEDWLAQQTAPTGQGVPDLVANDPGRRVRHPARRR